MTLPRWLRALASAALVLAAIGLAAAVVIPRAGNAVAGAAGIHDIDALPEHLNLCGRSWHRDALRRTPTLAAVRAETGVEPTVVDPAPFAGCPPGPCTNVALPTPCDTVIYVRVGDDAYLDYALQGGP